MPARSGTTEKKATVLDEALRLHAAGYWVVPQDGKRAVVIGWDANRLTEDDLRAYLADGRLSIAIALHRSDVMDVETDSPEGEAMLRRLLNGGQHTPTWKSRRGMHRLFKRPPGLPDRAKIEVDGIEFRIGNRPALTTLPPSVNVGKDNRPDGTVKSWLPDLSVWDITPAPLPAKLLDLLNRGTKGTAKRADEAVGTIPEGRRNDELFRYGCRLLRDGLGPDDVRNAVVGKNKSQCSPPLADAEVEGIVASVEQKRYTSAPVTASGRRVNFEARKCGLFEELEAAWREALYWRSDLSDALAVCLAVAASTMRAGDQQLFLQLIGSPGSAKTRLCDALIVSQHCYPLEHLTGFHSGWKDSSGEDHSLLARVNGKCMVTPEADVVMTGPHFAEIMAQQRRIFDGTSGASYKNRSEDLRYTGLRTPWIMAGTPEIMMRTDQSRLGDRFIRVFIREPSDEERKRILLKASMTEFATVGMTANCSADSLVEGKLRRAYELTGGYIDWLWENVERRIGELKHDQDEVAEQIIAFAEFTASLRARPDPDAKKDSYDTKELPARLVKQFVRLASCLAVAMNRPGIDNEVLRVVRKVAIDTARGKTLDMARVLHPVANPQLGAASAATADSVAIWTNQGPERCRQLLAFMRKIGALQQSKDKATARMLYRLSPRMREMYDAVVLPRE